MYDCLMTPAKYIKHFFLLYIFVRSHTLYNTVSTIPTCVNGKDSGLEMYL